MILSSLCEPIGFGPSFGNFAVLNPPRPPLPEETQPDEPSDDDGDGGFVGNPEEMPMTDDADWEVFIPDELERDPLPEPGDFWPDPDAPWN